MTDPANEKLKDLVDQKGFFAWFASNSVAANLLMIFLLATGVLALLTIKVEVFPHIARDVVKVSVPYLGASPAEVEDGVCLRVEEALSGIEDIKKISSVAAEGMGTIVAEVEDYADTLQVLDDVKSEVDRIETFPVETEKPIVADLDNRQKVITLAIYGQVSERTLKNLSEEVRDDLTAYSNISLVTPVAIRKYEISIEISEETLRKYSLTFDQVARAIRGSSLDLPGGSVKTQGGEILVRTKGQKYTGKEFEKIVVMTQNDGTSIFLSDVATIIDGFEDSDVRARFNGDPVATLDIYRIGKQGAINVANTVKKYAKEKQEFLPEGVKLATWWDDSIYLKSRIDLLTRNAIIGITLVFISLTFFLDLKLAFWTTMGIPISFIGAFMFLPQFGVSINMISLFAFILTLGIVVDDAIIVGENIFDYRQKGIPYLQAAIMGVKEMALPVTMAIMTTIAAFAPLLYVDGEMGKIMKTIPMVAIAVLLMSLVEALLILPAHLSGKKKRQSNGPITRMQKIIRSNLQKFIDGPFEKFLKVAVNWRYATLGIAVASLMIMVGFIAGGHISFKFFPEVEADNMVAALTMPQGTPLLQTEAIVEKLEAAAWQVEEETKKEFPNDGELIVNIYTAMGTQPFSAAAGGPHGPGVTQSSGSHLAEVIIELTKGEERESSAKAMANRWREIIGEIPGVSSLKFTSSFFSAGDAISMELAHRDFDTLVLAVEEFKKKLADFDGVSDITDNFEPGKRELKLALTDRGRTLGLTLGDLAKQIRQGFYGEEVQRIQRGRDDIRVMLRYPEDQRKNVTDVNNIRVRLDDGTEVPFNVVAQVEQGQGYAVINRANRRRVVKVTAEVDEMVSNANVINNDILNVIMPELQAEFPGLTFDQEGEQRAQNESLSSLAKNFVIAIIAIFGLLAVQFRSYIQPLIIMSAIPFGLIGAVIGHIIMGFQLTLLSMFGIVALTGVVVNDSLILIDLINRKRKDTTDAQLKRMVIESAQRRFRPIILTTMTTFFGLIPMILEQSLQAQFLVPMAISLGFGVVFATLITLVLIPTLYVILEDVRSLFVTPVKPQQEPTVKPIGSSA